MKCFKPFRLTIQYTITKTTTTKTSKIADIKRYSLKHTKQNFYPKIHGTPFAF